MLKKYPVDSAQAASRLIALAIVVDGMPSEAELEMLAQRGVLPRLGVSPDYFDRVVQELCADLQGTSLGDELRDHILRPRHIHGLLDEIQSPELRKWLAGVFFDVISADHRLHRVESALLWEALDHWGLRLRDVVGGAHEQTETAYFKRLDLACEGIV